MDSTLLENFCVSNLTIATMLNLKRKFHSKKRLNSASSSTAGSVSDLEDKVVMLCEDIPTKNSFIVDRGSQSTRARSSRGSQSDGHESGSEPQIFHLSRDRQSYRQACYVERESPQAQKEYYRVLQVYENFEAFLTMQNSLYILQSSCFIILDMRCIFLSPLINAMLCACAYMLLAFIFLPNQGQCICLVCV